MDYHYWLPRFDIRNNTLALLASETAIDIDNFIKGKSQEGKSVQYLSELFNNITQGDNPQAKSPDNGLVLGYAISGRDKFEKYWKGKNIDDVVLKIRLVSRDLKNLKNLEKEQQECLRDFCVRLSEEVSNHHNKYYPNRHRLVAYL